MSENFALIGVALQRLLSISTMQGAPRAEVEEIIEQLRSADDKLVEIVNDRVRAASEALTGEVAALKDDSRRVQDAVFAPPEPPKDPEPPEKEAEPTPEPIPAPEPEKELSEAQIKALDLDEDGEAGGSKPVEATDDPDGMTVAMLRKAIAAKGGDNPPANTNKADLREILASL